jgi:hypothetical protein
MNKIHDNNIAYEKEVPPVVYKKTKKTTTKSKATTTRSKKEKTPKEKVAKINRAAFLNSLKLKVCM